MSGPDGVVAPAADGGTNGSAPRDDLELLLAELYARALRLEPVITRVSHAELEAAVSAMQGGSHDFVREPIATNVLIHAIERALAGRQRAYALSLPHEQPRPHVMRKILGRSGTIRAVYDLVARVATTEAPVLVLGESGTGKELVARALHEASPRARGPFVALNCAALSASLIESELFGHVKGAFTDARQARDGLFVQATGGTLFLDEIADLPLELQPKLLRALQEREVRPVGGSQVVEFDARIVTATNADLAARIEAGLFRADLMYRIDVVRIELPPLRDRGRDVLVLAQHLVSEYGNGRSASRSFSEDASAKLLAYDWPGNVRELENCIQRALAVAQHEQIGVEDLPIKVRDHRTDRVTLSFEATGELVTLDELETRYIRKVLEMVDGNKAKAARLLGMDRRSLYRRIAKLDSR